MKLRIGLVMAIALSTLVTAAPAAPASRCESAYVDAYRVEARPEQHIYRVGDRTRVFVTVTERVTDSPAADVGVGVMLNQAKSAVFVGGRTNAEGRAVVEFTLEQDVVNPGWVTLQAMARRTVATSACGRAGLYGYRRIPRAFYVRY